MFKYFLILGLLSNLLTIQPAWAFPADAGALNVRDFGAKGDGITDDTAAINAALAASGSDTGPAFWQDKIVYFPNGTYLVSDRIAKRYASGHFASGAIMVGESREKTIITLANHTAGYDDKSQPKAVIFTAAKLLDPAGATGGGKDYYGKGEGNDAFMNFIENMTIETNDNKGAIGIDYLANNMGAIRNVTIRGNGATGIALTRKWIGPALIQNVLVDGFDVGMDVDNSEYGITLDHVTLNGQSTISLRNNHNVVSANQLTVKNSASKLENPSRDGLLVLIDSQISSYLHNKGATNLRRTKLANTMFDELSTNDVETGVSQTNWQLPIKDAPLPFEEPDDKWVSVISHGAKADDTSADSSDAIEKAFASGAKTIYFPHGIYYISRNITVPANVQRIVGMTSTIRATPTRGDAFKRDKGMFRVQNNHTPLTIERLAFDNSWQGDQVAVEAIGTQVVILRDVVGAGVTTLKRIAKAGEAFIENSCCGTMDFAGKKGIWARQLNTEGDGTRIINNGAPLWILGLKTEGMCTVIDSMNGAKTEVLGGLIYIARSQADPTIPAFKTSNGAKIFLSYAEESFNPAVTYIIHVDDTKDGVQTLTKASDLPKRNIGRMVNGFSN